MVNNFRDGAVFSSPKMEKTESEIVKLVVQSIRVNICEALFKYEFTPKHLEGDEYDMEVVRLYRALLTEALTKGLFDMVDAEIQTKLKSFNK